jgi:hypothetical protein
VFLVKVGWMKGRVCWERMKEDCKKERRLM